MSTAIEWRGMDECKALFARLKDKSDNLAPILDFAGNVLTESAKSRIAEEKKSPSGMPWQSLNPTYEKYKRKKSGGGLLQHSGNLLQSINYNRPSNNRVIVGASEEYAIYHQFGTSKMPARSYLGVSPEDSNIINKHIKKVLRGAN